MYTGTVTLVAAGYYNLTSSLGQVRLHVEAGAEGVYIEANDGHDISEMREILLEVARLGLVVIDDEEDEAVLTDTGVRRYCRLRPGVRLRLEEE